MVTRHSRSTVVLAALAVAAVAVSCSSDPESTTDPAREGTRPMLYVGGEGNINWYSLDEKAGTLEKKGGLTYPHAATFFAKSADGKFFYALLRTINEMAQTMAGKALEGFVATYTIDQGTGALTEIGRRSSEGDRPTYITIDKTGKFALVANNLGHMVGNSITVFPIASDGLLGEPVQKIKMTGIRAHQVRVSLDNKFVYVPNIDSDDISQYAFDAKTGQLTPLDPPAATVDKMFGPRHLDFHPNGKWLYLSNEYAANVTAYSINANGTLTQIGGAVSGVPADFTMRKWQSEIRVAPSGRFVYAGERVHETLAIFEVNQSNGELTLKHNEPTLGKTPRNFALTSNGRFLVVGNQESSSLVLYRVNTGNGMLEKLAGPMEQSTPYVHLFHTLP